jgi:hypothetical protein
MDEGAPWVVEAALVEIVEPIHLPERSDPAGRIHRRRRGARKALAVSIVGVLCLGFILGPLALGLGQRLRLAMILEEDVSSASTVHAAIFLARVGLALHLTLAMAALPWILFVVPLMSAG